MFWFRLQYKEMSDVPATMKARDFITTRENVFFVVTRIEGNIRFSTREILSRNNGANSALPITKFHQARFNAFFEKTFLKKKK